MTRLPHTAVAVSCNPQATRSQHYLAWLMIAAAKGVRVVQSKIGRAL